MSTKLEAIADAAWEAIQHGLKYENVTGEKQIILRAIDAATAPLQARIRELEGERGLALRELAKCDPAAALAIKFHDHPQQQEKEQ